VGLFPKLSSEVNRKTLFVPRLSNWHIGNVPATAWGVEVDAWTVLGKEEKGTLFAFWGG